MLREQRLLRLRKLPPQAVPQQVLVGSHGAFFGEQEDSDKIELQILQISVYCKRYTLFSDIATTCDTCPVDILESNPTTNALLVSCNLLRVFLACVSGSKETLDSQEDAQVMITRKERELRRMWQLKSESLNTPQDKVRRKGSRISVTSSTAETEKDVESTPRYVNSGPDQQPEIEDLKAMAAGAQGPGDDAPEAPSQEQTKKKPRSTRPPTSKAAAKPAAKRASRPAVPKSKADKKKDAAKRETAPKRKAAAKKEPKKVTTTVSAGNGGEEPKEKASVVADGKRKRADEPQDAKTNLRSTGSTDSIPSVLKRGCTTDQFSDEDLEKIAQEAEKAVDRARAQIPDEWGA